MTDALALYVLESESGDIVDDAAAEDLHKMMERRDYL